jgi:hypothetical protein
MENYKYQTIAVVKIEKDSFTTLGYINANSIAGLKRIVKADRNCNFRNKGIITICFKDREGINMNSNKL